MGQQKRARANGPHTATASCPLLQPLHGRRVRFLFPNANPSRDKQRVDFAAKVTEVGVAMERQSTHAGDLSICVRILPSSPDPPRRMKNAGRLAQ
jgi:hypothetical protein